MVADRVAAAVVPDAAIRQRLLETVDVGERLVLLSSALETWRRTSRGGATVGEWGPRLLRAAALTLCLVSVAEARPWAWLGVRIRDISEQEMESVAARHGVREGFGVVIVEVLEDTPAARAGIGTATSWSPLTAGRSPRRGCCSV